jgi:hypothetical protein
MEKAINGDSEALEKLNLHFPPPRPKMEVIVEPKKMPSRPTLTSSPRIRAPTIRYAAFALPLLILPKTNRRQTFGLFNHKLKHQRSIAERYGFYHAMTYHLRLEEEFLGILNILSHSEWNEYQMESGLRETRKIVHDLGRYIAHIELRENIEIEEKLRRWVHQNPGVQFKEYGERMTRREKLEMKRWKVEVNATERNRKEKERREEFMRRWRLMYGDELTHYQHPQARRLKRHAKNLRKRRLRLKQ